MADSNNLIKNEKIKRVFDLIVVLGVGLFLFIPAIFFMIGIKINKIITVDPLHQFFIQRYGIQKANHLGYINLISINQMPLKPP